MEERKYCIYYHKSPEGKYYIGQTCQNVDQRWKNGKGYKAEKFKKAIEFYGWENFEHGIIEDNIFQSDIDKKEAYYIEKYNSVDNGYNTYRENYSGYHFADLWKNEEIKNKIIGILMKQRNTEEYKKQQSQMMKQKWKEEEYRKNQKNSI